MEKDLQIKELIYFNKNKLPECHYIYTEEDAIISAKKNKLDPVKNPIRIAGDNCRSTSIGRNTDKKSFAYCFGHQKQLGVADPAKVDDAIGKSKKTWQDKVDKKEAEETLSSTKKGSDKEKRLDDLELLYHDIVQDKDFDLKKMYVAMYKQEMTIEKLKGLKQDLFALWYTREILTRKPKTLADVAKILGVSEAMLQVWIVEPEFEKKINSIRYRTFIMLSPHIDKKMCVKAMNGDEMAAQQFYRQIGLITARESGFDGVLETIPEDLKDDAINDSNLEENPSHTLLMNKGEQELVDKFNKQ